MYYRLTRPQQAIYEIEQFGTSEMVSNAFYSLLKGQIPEKILEQVLQNMVLENDVFHIRIHRENGEVYQKFEYQPVKIPVLSFSKKEEFDAWALEERKKAVCLPDQLFRLTGIMVEDSFGYFAVMHHILSDGYSMNVLLEQFQKHYQQYQDTGVVTKSTVPSFQEYLKKEKAYYSSKRYQSDVEYWKGQLIHGEDSVKLTGKIPLGMKADRETFIVPAHEVQKVDKFCDLYSVTRYPVFLTSLAYYLAHVSSKDSVNIGTSVLNRNGKAENHMVAMLVNTCFLNLSPDLEKGMAINCIETASKIIKLFRHQRLHYSEVRKLANEAGLSQSKFFDISFTYHPMDSNLKLGSIHWYPCTESVEGLNIHVFEQMDGSIHVYYDYQKSLYSAWEMKQLHAHLIGILKSSIKEPEAPLKDLCFVDREEENELIHMETGLSVPVKSQTIQERIEEKVSLFPDMEILECEGEVFTYLSWNRRVNQFANYLIKLGVQKEDRIAVLVPKKPERYIVLYGILKAGAAFVPIDPEYPTERIRFIIEDSGAKFLVMTKECLRERKIPEQCTQIIYQGEKYHYESSENPNVSATPEQLAYMIYTSGTTGRPKGVMVEQKGVLNLADYFERSLHITKEDAILQFANYVFDGSIWEMTMGFLCGAKLCAISDEAIRQESKFKNYIMEQKVTVMALPVPYFEQLDVSGLTLRTIITAGSASSKKVVEKALSCADTYVNSYGPTEATVAATHWEIHRGDCVPESIPIGSPIQNVKVSVRNKNGKRCGLAVSGELCIAGAGVARGYRNLDEKNSQSFQIEDGVKWYHTGDLARWQEDGTLEYLGRVDEQVKIRGFRVELSEITMLLKKEEGVSDACVVVKSLNGNDSILCAYVTGSQKLDTDRMTQNLKNFLPDYMVPDAIVWMEHFPLTVNGKIDKRALPDPKLASKTEYEEPETQLEKQICTLFEQVLIREKIGRKDRFFENGGHSLLAIRLLNLLEDCLHISVSYKEFVDNQTPEELALLCSGRESIQKEVLDKAEEKLTYPMASNQKRMFVLNQLPDSGTAYNAPTVWKVNGDLNCEQLKEALIEVIRRHEILRTKMFVENGQFLQKIVDETPILFQVIEDAKQMSLEQILTLRVKKIDLEKGPLVQVTVVKQKEKQCIIVLNLNHAVADGRSIEIFKQELFALYDGKQLAPVQFQYKDYSEWEAKHSYKQAEKFWKKQLEGNLPVLDFVLDAPRGKERSFQGAVVRLPIQLKQLDAFCQSVQCTEYQFFLSTLMILLGKFSRQEDILIGTPVLGRKNQQFMDIMGMFVNTILMRGFPKKEKTFHKFLEEMIHFCSDAYEYQDYPLEELLKVIPFEKDTSRNPLFDVMFVYEHEDGEEQTIPGLDMREVPLNSTIAKFDMTFTVQQKNSELSLSVEYATVLFKKETMEAVLGYWKILIEKVTQCPEVKIGDISLLEAKEEDKEEESVPFPRRTVVEQFESVACAFPDRVAVSFADAELTYQEFNEKANQIAHYLSKLGVGRNDFVVLFSERCLELLPAFYGILKCGAAYVPLDAKQPALRLQEILNDCKPKAVIVGLEGCKVQVNCPVISLKDEALLLEERDNLGVVNEPEDLCYMIYTSGTTGKPKGVMIQHKNLENFIRTDGRNQFQRAIAKRCDCVYMTNSIIFDITVQEMELPLSYGLTVVLSENELIEFTEEKKEQLLRYGKPGLVMTPSKLSAYLESKAFLEVLPHAAVIMVGAERFAPALFKTLRSYSNADIFNGYGPTETTCGISYYLCTEYKENMPIGTVLEGNEAFILNGSVRNPVLVPGELCIAGENVSKGYYQDEEKTAASFEKNPFGKGMLYHTGDLARFLSDGNLEYLGRIDQQVKIRGFRIETAEIERRICSIEGIQRAAVIVVEKEPDHKMLWAYYCASNTIAPEYVKEALEQILPEYMIPTGLMQIPELPMGATGKLDQKALPEIVLEQTARYVKPETEAEKKLCQCICEVLKIEKAGLEDSFYQLGGDSIKAIRIVSKLRECGYTVPLAEFLKAADIGKLARKVVVLNETNDQSEVTGVVPLTPIQQNFFQWKLEEPNHFNQAMLLKMGMRYEEGILRKALEALCVHHDILRAVYLNGEQRILSVEECVGYELKQSELLEGQDVKAQIEEDTRAAQKSISLERGPMLQVRVWKTVEDTYVLLIIHHLVVDQVSWQILLEDLNTAYMQAFQNVKVSLPKKTMSYKQWSLALQEYLNSEILRKEENYWNHIYEESRNLSGLESKLHRREQDFEERYGAITLTFSKIDTNDLKNAGGAYNMDISEVLLTAYALSLEEWTGEQAFLVFMEGHGREPIHKPVSTLRTVGWFTSVYPVLFTKTADYKKALIDTKETVRSIPNHGMGFNVLRQKEGSTLNEIPMEVSFNYLGEIQDEQSDGAFVLADMEPVETVSRKNKYEQTLMLNGRIYREQLVLEISYDRVELEDEKVRCYTEMLEDKIRDVMSFCQQQEEVVKTVSDYHAKDLTEDVLDELMDMF